MSKFFLSLLIVLPLLSASAASVHAADSHVKFDDVAHVVDSSAAETLAKIDRACHSAGEVVIESDDRSILCELALNRKERIAARFLLRAPFATSPHAFVRFRVDGDQDGRSIVHAQGWIEQIKSTGQRRCASLYGPNFDREMQDFFGGL